MSVDLGLDAPIIYRVPVVKLMNCSTEDINNRKMVILVPFFLLKLRERLRNKKYRTPENIASLKSLIKTDIMGSIDKNIELGNITLEDGHSFMATRKEVELISRFQRKGLYVQMLIVSVSVMPDDLVSPMRHLILHFRILFLTNVKNIV